MRQYYQDHKEEKRAYNKRYVLRNKAETLEYARKYKAENRGEINKKQREYYRENSDDWRDYREKNKEHIKTREAEWCKNNKDKVINQAKTRRAKKLNATVEWRNQFLIDEMYDLARLRTKVTGIEWHVDHIIPLKHKLICGLHVEDNLQVIPAIENLRKGNSFVIS